MFDGVPRIALGNAAGEVRLSISCSPPNDDPRIDLYNSSGKVCLSLTCSVVATDIALQDNAGNTRLSLSTIGSDGNSYVSFSNLSGEMIESFHEVNGEIHHYRRDVTGNLIRLDASVAESKTALPEQDKPSPARGRGQG